ncbi:hypothetical protein HN011_003788 [Eciton burchellii]|nr:hypothetical protein HN011_003788 [Eciton burchellii]
MDINEDWDVEQYKVEHESDEHWELRRNFLLAHKNKYSEDTLVCLAQVFVNVELLGCSYPEKTMDIVKKLSEDIAAEYREKQKKKLQRTFVGASEAASSKVKGNFKTSSITKECIPNTSKSISNTAKQLNSFKKLDTKKFSNIKEQSISNKTQCQSFKKLDEGPSSKKLKLNNVTSYGDYSYEDIVLWERANDLPQNILDTSAKISGAKLEWQYVEKQGVWECIIYLNTKKLTCRTSFNKKSAKNEAASNALNKLRKCCYTIKVKENTNAKSNVTVTTKKIKPETNVRHDDDWKEFDCIGKKMMKMMGWMGGGLGKSEQGVVEPMSATVQSQVSRKGFGLKSNSCATREMKAKCENLFKDFLKTDMQNDIVFLDFTNDERKMIHQIAWTMGLKSRSYGPSDKRKLIISRKIEVRDLLNELKNFGGITEKYELIEPTNKKFISLSTSTSS